MLVRRPLLFSLLALLAMPIEAQQKPTPAKAPAQKPPPPSVLPAPQLLGTPIRRLPGMPITAAYNRDGSLLLGTCFDATAAVFDPRSGKVLATLVGQGIGGVGAFCGSKQERIVVAFQEDGVRFFEARSGKLVGRLEGAGAPAVSPDGLTVAVGKGKDLLLVDAATLKPKATIKSGGEVTSAQFSADGKQVIVGVLDAERRPLDTDEVVDVLQKKVVGKQPSAQLRSRSLPLPDGKTALRWRAVGLSATNVERYELPDGPAIGSCKVPLLASAFLVLRDGASLVAADTDGRMVQVDFQTGEVQRSWAAHASSISRLLASPDGQQFVSMSWDGAVKFWNVEDGSEQFPAPQHNHAVYALAFAADGAVVSGAADGTVIRWGGDGSMAQRSAFHEGVVAGVAATGAGLWSASLDSTLRLVDAGGAEVAKVALEGKYAFPMALCSAADGTLITGHRDGTVQWRDGKTGDELRRGDHHRNGVQVVACDASGATVLSGGVDGHVVFWDPATASPRAKAKAHDDGVRHLCIGPGGEAWSCGDDGEVKQWDVASGELVRSAKVGSGRTRLDAVAVSAKAGFLLAAAHDTLFCLSLADLKPVGEVKLPADCVALATTADGARIAAGLSDGTVALFDLARPVAPPAPPTPPAKAAPGKSKR